MKKNVFIAFLSAVISMCQAQHTLTYNRTMLVSTTQTVPSIAGDSSYNAMWKIVSVMPSANSYVNQVNTSSSPGVGTYAILVGGNTVYLSSVDAGYYSATTTSYTTLTSSGFYNEFTNVNGKLFPMWLPGGTSLAASTGIQYVSVIEFIVN